jgi:NAD(P)H-hydrate epimerase
LLLPQNQVYTQQMHSVLIGLNINVIENLRSSFYYTDPVMARSRWKPRPKYAHKGTFGHALLLLGSYGKMGAAILSTRACLRSGAGLVSVSLPQAGYQIMQTAAPEAMVLADPSEKILTELPPDLDKYAAIGMGPGIGQAPETKKMLGNLLEKVIVPLVLDADALNLLAADKTLLPKLPPETILTPHPKEFERLTQPFADDFERMKVLREFCGNYRCYVVLKGANTCIGTPSGNLYFNSTGNPGMATGGSGDVLTGMITALRAQGYTAEDACILGVYIHGLAGDLARNERGETALIASDIIENLGKAFQTLEETVRITDFGD